MNPPSRLVCLPSLAVALLASPAYSDVPDRTQSEVDPVVIGNSGGTPIGVGFRVFVRDINNNPVNHSLVTIHFASATSRPYELQNPGTTVDCNLLQIAQTSDVAGVVTFHPRMGGFDNASEIEVRAQGVLLALVPARSTDLNGDGTTDVLDEALFERNFAENPQAPETDYNDDGITDALDRAIFQEELLRGSVGMPCIPEDVPKSLTITATDVKDPKPGVTVQEQARTILGGPWSLDLVPGEGTLSKARLEIRENCDAASNILFEAEFQRRDLQGRDRIPLTTPWLSAGTYCVSLFIQGSRGASATLEIQLP